MRRKHTLVLLVFCISQNIVLAQESFKMMFYNLLNFPSLEIPENRIQYLNVVLSDYQPDVFMVCELNSEEGSDAILASLQAINPDYEQAIFADNSSGNSSNDGTELQNMLYYDSSKFIIESQTVIPSLFRDFNHYKLKLNTVDQATNPIYLDAIVCHLKASSGEENVALRAFMINDLEAYLDTFPVDSNVLLAGDFNMYNSAETGYVRLLNDSNTIVFKDPANRPGFWHSNSNYIDVMTQSTRTQSDLGGASGGFDDRFDFILTSQNMVSDADLRFTPDSYLIYGNNQDSGCFNQAINSTQCEGGLFSFELRDALHNFSDHLPVTLLLETDATLGIETLTTQSTIQFIDGNLVHDILKLKLNNNLTANQTLYVYDSIGRLIKTINTNNSIYINEDISILADGWYYIVSPHISSEPLKFVKAP